MNQKKELIKNTLIISIGKFSTQIVSFLLLPLYTSLLTTSEYGSYDLLNTISIFLIPCITLLMDEGMFRFLIDVKNEKEKGEVFSITTSFCIISFVVWSLIILLFGMLIKYPLTIYLILYIFASILSALAGSSARGLGKFKIYSVFCFLSSFFNILLNILFIAVLKLGLPSLFLSYIIANSLVSIWLLIKINLFKLVNLKNINRKKQKEMIKYSLPLVPNSISWNAIALTDKLLITNILGSHFNGIYSIGNKFPTIINTCYGYFNLSWKESASKVVNSKDKNKFYNDIYKNLNNFLICVSILVISFLPFVFNLLIKNSYRESYIYIPLMVIGVYFSNLSNFSSGIFSAYKDTKVLANTTIVATIVNIIVGASLIHFIGLFAPIVGTLISYIVIYFYRHYKLKKYIVLEKNNNLFLNTIILLIVLVAYYSKNMILISLGFIISIVYTYILNKEIINVILRKVLKHGN